VLLTAVGTVVVLLTGAVVSAFTWTPFLLLTLQQPECLAALVATLAALLILLSIATWTRPTWPGPERQVVVWWLASSPVAAIAGLVAWGSVYDRFGPHVAVVIAGLAAAVVVCMYVFLARRAGPLVLWAVPLAACLAPILAPALLLWLESLSSADWGLGGLVYFGETQLLSVVAIVPFAAAYARSLTAETEAVRARDEWMAKTSAPSGDARR
jgi:hypothetical protein